MEDLTIGISSVGISSIIMIMFIMIIIKISMSTCTIGHEGSWTTDTIMISFIMILIDANLHDWTRGFVNMVIKVCGKGSTQEGWAKVDRDARKPEHHDDRDNHDDMK